MNKERLKYLNNLQRQIECVEEELICAKGQECSWIIFTFGNGSNQETVTSYKEDIAEVRELLIKNHTARLAKLRAEFEDL